LVRRRGHKSLRAFTRATGLARSALYRTCSGTARESTIAKVAARLRIPIGEIRQIIALRERP
jgi:hypothetical protein